MLFPIRCITCGKVINQFYKPYLHKINEENITKKDALDSLKIVRYCCRRMFLCHEEMFDYISEFDKSDYSFIHDKIDVKPVNFDENVRDVDADVPQDIDIEIDMDVDMDMVDVDVYADVYSEPDVDADLY